MRCERLVWRQLAFGCLFALPLGLFDGMLFASALWGGLVATANGWLHCRAHLEAFRTPERLWSATYSGWLWRMLATLALFGAGFMAGLSPLPALLVFALVQAVFAGGLRQTYRNKL